MYILLSPSYLHGCVVDVCSAISAPLFSSARPLSRAGRSQQILQVRELLKEIYIAYVVITGRVYVPSLEFDLAIPEKQKKSMVI